MRHFELARQLKNLENLFFAVVFHVQALEPVLQVSDALAMLAQHQPLMESTFAPAAPVEQKS
jgi:hypothetical protein